MGRRGPGGPAGCASHMLALTNFLPYILSSTSLCSCMHESPMRPCRCWRRALFWLPHAAVPGAALATAEAAQVVNICDSAPCLLCLTLASMQNSHQWWLPSHAGL